MRKYKIVPAHSGTSDAEIRKAKRLYRIGVKSRKFLNADEVMIRFTDCNYVITAYYEWGGIRYPLGSTVIN